MMFQVSSLKSQVGALLKPALRTWNLELET